MSIHQQLFIKYLEWVLLWHHLIKCTLGIKAWGSISVHQLLQLSLILCMLGIESLYGFNSFIIYVCVWLWCSQVLLSCYWKWFGGTSQETQMSAAFAHFMSWKKQLPSCNWRVPCVFAWLYSLELLGCEGTNKRAVSQNLTFRRRSRCLRFLYAISLVVDCYGTFAHAYVLGWCLQKVECVPKAWRPGLLVANVVGLALHLLFFCEGKAFDTVVISRWLLAVVRGEPLNERCVPWPSKSKITNANTIYF